ncbi:Glycerophosphoryl diester phosphodiesterase family-domain-containing protein [Xylariales sp. AK1849]|nr:Glycerophosphoryl diester phosphodiesterase family-domain-containing protein [Xylariales sp. AK1849]
MKFGCDYQRLQVPQWADAYINYDALKQLAKQKSRSSSHQVDAFKYSLEEEVVKVNAFLRQQCSLLDLWIEATLSRFGISTISSLEAQVLPQVTSPELQDLGNCLDEILADFNHLEIFSKLNRDAIQRLGEKLSLVTSDRGLTLRSGHFLYTRPWVEKVSRLRDCLDLVRQAGETHEESSEIRSLLLSRVSPLALGCTSDEVNRSIKVDDSAALMCVMASPVSYLENQAMLYSVLQVAIVYRAPRCITSLLEEITAPIEQVGCGHQDALHQLIAQAFRARTPGSPFELEACGLSEVEEVFRELSPYQHHMLLAKDWRQRYPLHYAAQHGLASLCSQIAKHMEPAAILDPDVAGQTPLQLAVCSGQLSVVASFLELDTIRCMLSEQAAGSLLAMAIRARFSDVAEYLIRFGKGLNSRAENGQTALFNATETGQVELAEALLTVSARSSLDLTETSRGWSPLIVACVRDHVELVKLFLHAGADRLTQDHQGWSAVDHASYRGHMTIVEMLQQASAETTIGDTYTKSLNPSQPLKHTHLHRPTYLSSETPPHVKDLTQTSVFINLGSFDLHSKNQVLELDACAARQGRLRDMQNMLLEISASPCQEQPYRIQMPFLGDISDVTWLFSTTDPDEMKLTFQLFHYVDNGNPDERLFATGIALLGSTSGWFRPERQSLRRESTVALAALDGSFAGTITFTFLVCQPHKALGMPKPIQRMCLSKSTQIVGHRGLGWNVAGLGRMQIGEHTIQSLQSALDQGAGLIEFDVQVTRDRVPVIYHDWHVSETGLDVPIHSMTFAQWMAISDAQTKSHHETPRGRLPWDERARPSAPPRRDSRSLCAHPDHPRKALAERMKHTVEYSKHHNKGNIRGDCIHEQFVSLRQLFEKFPEEVSFDIELKYPMLWECPYWEMEPYWIEMNQYIDTTLNVVFELGGNRSIFFTCFNPEVCILLSTKQKTYPVVFLNDSMVSGPAGDKRATSLQQAIRFARRWDLQGIVMAAETFVAAPKLIKHVKDQGLYCGSYGSMNDVPEFAKKQAREGIDSLIVNNIRLISNTLRRSES